VTILWLGVVSSSPERRNARFIVTRNKDVINVIVPHFNQYKLEGNKQKNFVPPSPPNPPGGFGGEGG
jgi:hypothetical protein